MKNLHSIDAASIVRALKEKFPSLQVSQRMEEDGECYSCVFHNRNNNELSFELGRHKAKVIYRTGYEYLDISKGEGSILRYMSRCCYEANAAIWD
jgi:hypothetical protein